MKQIVLKYGLLAGFIVAVLMSVGITLLLKGRIDLDRAELAGYSSMFLAFLLVFFGVRSYRDNVQGGAITFGRAFKVGILITLVTCAIYVIAWEIVYFNFLPDFTDRYAALMIEKMEKSGESAAAIEKMRAQMAEFKVLYANPLINSGITFMEIFPMGLVMTLISAAILKEKGREPTK